MTASYDDEIVTDDTSDDTPEVEQLDVAEPETVPVPEDDPVTARSTDPATMSEAERNRRLTEQYEPPAPREDYPGDNDF